MPQAGARYEITINSNQYEMICSIIDRSGGFFKREENLCHDI